MCGGLKSAGSDTFDSWYAKKSPSSPGKEDGDSNSRGTTSYYQSETDLSAISLCKQLICSSLTVGIRSGLLGSMGEWPVDPDSLQGMFFFLHDRLASSGGSLNIQSWKRMCPAHCLFFKPNYNSFENFTIRKINKISIKSPKNLVVMMENDIKTVE